MTGLACPSCGRKSADGLLCQQETQWLRKDLKNLPEWMGQLTLTYSRQTQHNTGGGAPSAQTPIPYDPKAAQVRDDITRTLAKWISVYQLGDVDRWVTGCECRPYQACRGIILEQLPFTASAWCNWLLNRINRIRGHETAPEFARAMTTAVRKVRRKVDVPPDRLFCGPCDFCGTDLYAPAGKDEIVCRRCALVAGPGEQVNHYDVKDRQEWLLEGVRTRLATAQEIVTALPGLYGVTINSGTFRSWVSRNRIESKSTYAGVPMYSVNDVLTLATEAAARNSRPRHVGNT